jgi:hypothetical protein
MEFDIKELAITLMVGAFTILGFEAILHCFFGKGPIGKFGLNRKSTKEQPLTVVMLVVLAFGLGLIAEDLSLKYVDTNDFPFRKYPAQVLGNSFAQRLGLPPATDDRAISLIGSFEDPNPDPVAQDLATNGAFMIDDTKGTGSRVQRWILKGVCDHEWAPPSRDPGSDDCPSKGDVEAAAKSLYYYSKNTAYSHPESYDELKRIEDRLQFERSVSMFAFIYFGFSVALAILLLAWRVITLVLSRLARVKRFAKRFEKIRWAKVLQRPRVAALRFKVAPLRNKIYPYRWRWRFVGVAIVLLAVYFFTIWAYGRESDAFNRRAFGYLSTKLISEKRQQNSWPTRPKECSPNDPARENQKSTP